MLVAGGAKLTVRDRSGNTPRELALAAEDRELAAYLHSKSTRYPPPFVRGYFSPRRPPIRLWRCSTSHRDLPRDLRSRDQTLSLAVDVVRENQSDTLILDADAPSRCRRGHLVIVTIALAVDSIVQLELIARMVSRAPALQW